MKFNRREFLGRALALGAFGALGLSSRRAQALGLEQSVTIMRLQHEGGAELHPGAVSFLLSEVTHRTSIVVAERTPLVSPMNEGLSQSMMAVVIGNGPFRFTDEERARLGRWVGLGGLLVFDNAGRSRPDAGFDASVREEIKALFPDSPPERISPEHVLYRTFYRLDYPAGRAIHQAWLEGVRVGSRYGVIVSNNDLFGAMARRGSSFAETPVPGGERQREMAIRLGINLVMYATCIHYKDDQAHLDALLHRRKWKIQPPQ